MRARVRVPILMVVCAVTLVAAVVSVFHRVTPARADPVSGAIFTTDVTGTEVNVNQYAFKTDVYLNGGPGINAPPGAAGLPDGTYFFQVTDPSGKTRLSSDAIGCRQVGVLNGVFTGPIGPPTNTCPHAAGGTTTFNGTTVQLFPFNDTPNNGDEYKVWVTNILNFNETGCVHLVFGFCPADSKTDNFKVEAAPIREIDTQFISLATNQPIDGLSETWTDTLGASNVKWQYTNPSISLYHYAHIEAVETGTHHVTISNQAGCTVSEIDTQFPGQPGAVVSTGPATVSATIPKSNNRAAMTWYIFVYCS